MSAIVGILNLEGRPVERPVLEQMVNSLAHRGADGVGVWSEGNIGIGHRMLWTTPESLHEELPLANKAGNLVITADARLDNRDELIHALDLGGPGDAMSDSVLILEAYEKWGERCPEKLLGDFVFAIWDRRRQTLFCARDHMGIKPFYYHQTGRVFVFATEIKALLCVPEVPRRLNETRVADYLVPMVEDEVITFYRGIYRLPPRSRMSVGRVAVPPRSYWSLDSSRDVRFRSDAEYAEAFREIFTEAVRSRLRSASPVGSLLSGGLDSSSIVCTARKLLEEEGNRRLLHTFSCLFDDIPESDERGFINAILAGGRLEAHSARTDLTGPLTDLERLLWHHDEAFFVSNLFLNWSLYGIVRQQGVRTLLDGVDGDTVVSHGEMYLADLARTGRWMTLAAEARAFSKHTGSPLRGVLREWVLSPLAPEPVRWTWRALRRLQRRGVQSTWVEGTNIIKPDFSRRIGIAERFRALDERYRPARTEREDHLRQLDTGMNSLYFEEDDKTAAAFSVQHRYPFYDKRVVEFCLALPPEQKLKRGWDRVILRRAMAGLLPEEVQWRSDKTDFGPTFDQGLLKYRRKFLEEVIFDDLETVEEYVDVPSLRETYRCFASRGEGEDSTIIWGAVTLAVWLRRTGLSP